MLPDSLLLAVILGISALIGSSFYAFLPLIYAALLQWVFFYIGVLAIALTYRVEGRGDWVELTLWGISLFLLGLGLGVHGLLLLAFAKVLLGENR